MKIFYSDYQKKKHVLSSQPEEINHIDARVTLNRLRKEGSFMGIFLQNQDILQLIREREALITVELISKKTGVIEKTTVNIPMAEYAVEAAFSQSDVKSALDEFFVKWTTVSRK
jgi:hypothetical protein